MIESEYNDNIHTNALFRFVKSQTFVQRVPKPTVAV